MIKTRFETIIEEGDGSVMEISEDAPDVLWNAIEDANSFLSDSHEPFVLRSVGEPRRALEFGAGEVAFLQTESATLFVVKLEDGIKILSVGVSRDGYLTEDQIEEALSQIGKDVKLTSDERLTTQSTSIALRSIRQSRDFLIKNYRELSDSIADLEELLIISSDNPEAITDQAKVIEKDLHNLLSSVYTFRETVDKSLKELEISARYKYLIQEFNDKVSTAIGLRHCIQHRMTLRVRWIGSYSHPTGFFDYTIGVPLSQVDDPDLYKGKPSDATGERHPPTEYYYGGIDNRVIDIQSLNQNVRDSVEEVYQELKNELQDEEIEGSELMENYVNVLGWRAQEYLNN